MSDPRQEWTTARLVSGMQYFINPDTGERLLTLDELVAELESRAMITRYAVIVHDDTHAHWVAACDKKGVRRNKWADWFKVPEANVWRIIGGEDGLADCLMYMLHKGAVGKVVYDPSEVTSSYGWDWQGLVRDRETHLAVVPSARQFGAAKLTIQGQVMKTGLSVAKAITQTNIDVEKLRRHRASYLLKQPPPQLHVNMYVEHPGGPRRDPFAHALAQTVTCRDSVFVAGRWDMYDGEETVMWFDTKPREMAKELGGGATLFRSLTPSPKAQGHTFVGGTQLVNKMTIVVSSQPFAEFRAELEEVYASVMKSPAGAKAEATLSFPVFVPVSAKEFGVQLLSQYVDDSRPVGQYVELSRIQNRFGETEQATHSVPPQHQLAARKELRGRMFKPVTEAHKKVVACARQPVTVERALQWADEVGLGEPITDTKDNETKEKK